MYQFLRQNDDDFGVRLLKIWRLNSREIHTDKDKIYTAENFDRFFFIFRYFDTEFLQFLDF